MGGCLKAAVAQSAQGTLTKLSIGGASLYTQPRKQIIALLLQARRSCFAYSSCAKLPLSLPVPQKREREMR